jgi:hypothetical protein
LRRIRTNRNNVLRFIAKTRKGEEVVVAPSLEAFRLISTGEIDVVSEPVWRMFTPDHWCLVQKLFFSLLHDVLFIVTTNDLMIVPPPNVVEDKAYNWEIDYGGVKIITERSDDK